VSFLKNLFQSNTPLNPEQLIDAVIKDIEHRLTEARIQMAASELAHSRLKGENDTAEDAALAEPLHKLESTLNDLKSRRNLLIARAQDADAHLAIEKALMEVGAEPAQVAIDMLTDKIHEAESNTEAIKEIRSISMSEGSSDV